MDNIKETILQYLCQTAFNATIREDTEFISHLRICMHKMEEMISEKAYKNAYFSQIDLENIYNIYNKIAHKSLPDDEPLKQKTDKKSYQRTCYECAFVMLYNFTTKTKNEKLQITSIEQFLEQYPEFANDEHINQEEIGKLLVFRNVMCIALQCIPFKKNKNRLLEICTHIAEGNTAKYITGSGQTAATARRVIIYEQEAGPCFKKRMGAHKYLNGTYVKKNFKESNTFKQSNTIKEVKPRIRKEYKKREKKNIEIENIEIENIENNKQYVFVHVDEELDEIPESENQNIFEDMFEVDKVDIIDHEYNLNEIKEVNFVNELDDDFSINSDVLDIFDF